MNPPGHIAFSYLLAERRGQVWSRALALGLFFGALLPDIIDKSLKLAGVYPWGRTVGHSVLVFALFALTWLWMERRGHELPFSRGIVLGWASHFAADFVDDLVAGIQFDRYTFSAWFTWPYLNPDLFPLKLERAISDSPCSGCYTAIEGFVVLIFVLVAIRKGRQ